MTGDVWMLPCCLFIVKFVVLLTIYTFYTILSYGDLQYNKYPFFKALQKLNWHFFLLNPTYTMLIILIARQM